MARISQGKSCNIPEGYDNATVTNTDANKQGAYQITGDGTGINKQIDGGAIQNTLIHKNPVEVTNSGKPILDVANCN